MSAGNISASPVDAEHLTGISMGDREFEVDLLQEFLSTTPELLRSLRATLEQRDGVAAQRHAHTAKGSCRSIGANPMADACQVLEASAGEGNFPQAQEQLDAVLKTFEELRDHINSVWGI